ncbi:hypothetical protein BDA99DRAFT_205170 [Phascolomyces articulosus]|uniref:Uncharacterized protein n=1 Tax=Phascolomyces articulosus TaxID=60185 RepID=A0AAD5K1N5_9FUNG|nr:hypothetical protein BDA99DRAFT_205170 [Phascolomyces articulosus]
MVRLPIETLLRVSDILRKFEWTDMDEDRPLMKEYDTDDTFHCYDSEHKDIKLIIQTKRLFQVYIFTPLMTLIATCQHLDYCYVKIDMTPETKSGTESRMIHDTINTTLSHLELDFAKLETFRFLSLLIMCPNVRVLRIKTKTGTIEEDVLDDIRHQCNHLEYLSLDWEDELLIGQDLYETYCHPKEQSQL